MTKVLKQQQRWLIGLAIVLAILLRWSLINYESSDFRVVLINWYHNIVNGGFTSLGEGFYNYNPPYMYLMFLAQLWLGFLPPVIAIKLIAIPFDFLAAFLVYKIVGFKYRDSHKSILAFGVLLFTPTVFINSAYWGQCDIIYTTSLLGSLYFLLQKRQLLAVFAFGVAIAFKAQAIFFFPVLLILWLKREINFWSLLIIPLVYVIALVPAYLVGRPWQELLRIYLAQTDSTQGHLTINAPNLYQWVPTNFSVLFLDLGLFFTGGLVALLGLVLIRNKSQVKPEIIIQLSLIFVTLIPYFLPKMHERYFFAADVISVIYAFYYPQLFFIPIMIILSSLFSYIPYFLGYTIIPLPILSGVMLIVIIILLHKLQQTLDCTIVD